MLLLDDVPITAGLTAVVKHHVRMCERELRCDVCTDSYRCICCEKEKQWEDGGSLQTVLHIMQNWCLSLFTSSVVKYCWFVKVIGMSYMPHPEDVGVMMQRVCQ